jgi:hypothetical protein
MEGEWFISHGAKGIKRGFQKIHYKYKEVLHEKLKYKNKEK